MATTNFILKSVKKGSLATLYVRLRHGRNIDIIIPTEFKLPPEIWSNKTQSLKQRYNYTETFTEKDARDIEEKLSNLKNDILKNINKRTDIDQPFSREWLQRIVSEFHNPKIRKTNQNLNEFIDSYIKELESGKRLTIEKQELYKPLTIKNFKGFQSQFNLFQEGKKRKYNYEHITMDFYDEFIRFFNAKNYSPNTIGRHIKNLKTIMHVAREEGLHNNSEIDRKKFKILKEPVYNIYLNENELNRIKELNLSGKGVIEITKKTGETVKIHKKELDIARDIFLVGCWTAQRFSDYSRIRKENVRKMESGKYVIDITQKKTGERVIIPVKPELYVILKKYDFNLPKTYEQKINERIKEVCKLAKINELLIVPSTRGGLSTDNNMFKYELVKTHTARRSGITNQYLAGIPTYDIMQISGHRTEREFLKYIKVGKEETAKKLSGHSYYNTPLRIAN